MKDAVELANSILNPKHVSQRVTNHFQKQLEQMAQSVLDAAKNYEPLREQKEELEKKVKSLNKKLDEASEVITKMNDSLRLIPNVKSPSA